MNTYQPFAAVSSLPSVLRWFQKNEGPRLVEHVYCKFCRCSWIRVPLLFLLNKWQSGQMTMPARCASQLSSKWCAVLLLIVFQSLISYVIPWNIEHWPECQSELCYMWRWRILEITRSCRSVSFWHRFVSTLKHRVFWGAACVVCVCVWFDFIVVWF